MGGGIGGRIGGGLGGGIGGRNGGLGGYGGIGGYGGGIGGYGLYGGGIGGYGLYGGGYRRRMAYGGGGLSNYSPSSASVIVGGGSGPNGGGYGGAYGSGYGGGLPYGGAGIYPPDDIFGSPIPGGETAPAPRAATATVQVSVPVASAEFWFNGAKTQTTGLKREFVTPELPPGQTYAYEVRARWVVNGKEFDQTRKMNVQAGGKTVLNFAADAREQLPAPAVVPPTIKI